MDEVKTYTIDEAQLYFAKKLNGKVWELLQKKGRSRAEDEEMVYAAYASCYHWLNAGTGLHHQRGEWLIAHVYTVLGMSEQALRHATRCLELSDEYSDEMKDFDRAYAYEAMGRANALAGNRDEARQYIQCADELGRAIKNDEDKSIFLGDFNGGDWHGLR
jgi:tetratricopeptide (TPR) repeat protein